MSVHQTPQGGWRVRWREEGRNRSRTFDRKRDAEDHDHAMRRRAQLGVHAPADPSRDTLQVWLEAWWARDAKRWARSTRMSRGYVLDRWVTPYLGRVRLCDLGAERLREWQSVIVDDGCTRKHANRALRELSAALGAAVKDRKLPANPCVQVDKYRVEKAASRALTPEEVERLRLQLHGRDRVLLALLAYAGLRPEEALALEWEDVAGLINVGRARTHGETRPTKTYQTRAVPILPPLAEDLEAYRRELGAAATGLIAPGALGQHLDLNNWRHRVWVPACERAGVQASPKDGRTTYAVLLIHGGASPLSVAAALGHESAATTWKHYARVFQAARLGAPRDPEEAIRDARRRVDPDADVPSRFPAGARRHLRLVAPGNAAGA